MNNNLTSPRILIYQDEDCQVLVDYLKYKGYTVITTTESDLLFKIRKSEYDLCILSHYRSIFNTDLLKPLNFLRKISSKAPVIMVSDRHDYSSIIEAFDAGADDYVTRPYNIEELIRRIRALLNRCGVQIRTIEKFYMIGDYAFDTVKRTLTINGSETRLSNKLNGVLSLLCAYMNEALPTKVIMQHLWGDDNYFNKRSLDVHIWSLRNMLKMDERITIETRRGIGFALIVAKDDDALGPIVEE